MAISRQKKEDIIKKVTDIVKNSASVVFVNFHGLSVADANALRRELRERGVSYTVAKKTLVKRMLQGAKIVGETPSLDGELALAYGDDPIAPSKSIVEFEKKLKNVLKPLGGIFESRFIDALAVRTLASIPPREVLYGQFVMVINAPIQNTVQVLSGVTRSFVSVLHQIAEQNHNYQ